MPADHVSRFWQRSPRFSVRGLIVLVLLIGVWLGFLVHSVRIQREAVGVVAKAGGSVEYHRVRTKSRGGWPSWLVDRIGADYFDHVDTVRFVFKCSDADLTYVGRLSGLVNLQLAGVFPNPRSPRQVIAVDATDAGLVQLTRLTRLEQLWLAGTRVTSDGLVHVKGLNRLEELGLSYTAVTDSGLVHLKGLKKLSYLALGGTRVADAGLAHLEGLTKIATLDFAAPRSQMPASCI